MAGVVDETLIPILTPHEDAKVYICGKSMRDWLPGDVRPAGYNPGRHCEMAWEYMWLVHVQRVHHQPAGRCIQGWVVTPWWLSSPAVPAYSSGHPGKWCAGCCWLKMNRRMVARWGYDRHLNFVASFNIHQGVIGTFYICFFFLLIRSANVFTMFSGKRFLPISLVNHACIACRIPCSSLVEHTAP